MLNFSKLYNFAIGRRQDRVWVWVERTAAWLQFAIEERSEVGVYV